MDSDDRDCMFNERWFHVTCSSDLSHIRCHAGAYFRFGGDLRIFMEITCLTIDDFMSSDLRPGILSMPYWGIFPFRRRFTDLHRCYMCDDRGLHIICSSDLSRIWCHAGAYFRFRWDLLIFMEVTCATIDDFMSFCSSDLSCTWLSYWGIFSILDEIYGSSLMSHVRW